MKPFSARKLTARIFTHLESVRVRREVRPVSNNSFRKSLTQKGYAAQSSPRFASAGRLCCGAAALSLTVGSLLDLGVLKGRRIGQLLFREIGYEFCLGANSNLPHGHRD